MQLFYNEFINETSKEIKFDKEESRHIFKVLRKQEGSILNLTNGKGLFFKVTLIHSNLKNCMATVLEVKRQEPLSYSLHLAVAPTKLNDRYEWFLEKATEIGIDEITPIICDHSERKVIKKERLEKVLISAMKQSLKFQLPKFNNPMNVSTFIQGKNHGDLFIAHCEGDSKESLKSRLKQRQSLTILIGPEGDFSWKEIELAFKNNFTPVTLGSSRLRTETAGVAVAQSVAFFNQ